MKIKIVSVKFNEIICEPVGGSEAVVKGVMGTQWEFEIVKVGIYLN